MLLINEIFYSIQGEGPNVGKPAVFLRLGGCNLACEWCDSKYTWHPKYADNKIMTIDLVTKKIKKYSCKHLVITGGEPLLQQDHLVGLLKQLKGYYIEIETNGTIPLKIGRFIEQINCSPKLKNSGNAPYPLKIRPTNKKTIYKFVVTNVGANEPTPPKWLRRLDHSRLRELNDIKKFIKKYKIPKERVYLMPEGTSRKAVLERSKWLVEICKKEGFNFSPRLHIMLYGNKRGL